MVKENKIYDQPVRIYGAVEFGFAAYQFNELSKEHLAKYNGGIVLEYDDKSVAYAKVSHGVLNGVYVRYSQGRGFYSPIPSARGRFKKGLPEGVWEFNQWLGGMQTGLLLNVQVQYKAGKMVGRPKKAIVVGNERRPLTPKELQHFSVQGGFHAPKLQNAMARRLPTRVVRRQQRTFSKQIERDE